MKIRRALLLFGGGIKRLLNLANLFSFEADHTTPRDGVLPVYKPYGGLGDFTVVRGSSATYVDSDGIIKEAFQLGDELVTNGDFSDGSTGWTFNSAAQNGGVNVVNEELVFTSPHDDYAAVLQANKSKIGRTYEYSFEIKDKVDTSTTITIQVGRSNIYNGQILFLDTGVHTGTIEAVHSDGFNVSVRTDGEVTIDNISVKEISYDIARIDWTNGVAELLTEPQSTNLLLWSDLRDNWTKSVTTVLDGQPDYYGQNNASLITNTADGTPSIRQDFTATVGETSISINIKSVDCETVRIFNLGSTQLLNFYFLTEQVEGNTYLRYEINNLGDGWFNIKATSTGNDSRFYIYPARNDTTQIGKSMYVSHPQLEELPYATSYIPTNGSTVTRLKDVITDGGNSSVINSEEGVMFFDGSVLFNDGTSRQIGINKGISSFEDLVDFTYRPNENEFRARIYSGSVTQSAFTTVLSNAIQNNKIAIKWRLNDCALWINGLEIATDTSAIMPIGLDTVNFRVSSAYFFGRTRELKVYDRALTDEELQSITEL